MFKLVIQDDEGKTTVVPLIRDEITIGRKEGNTIRLTERNVSRRHARIMRNNGEVHIEDLGSYNGIRVNNARIAERVSLRVSDQVQIGDYKLYLKAEGVEQVDDARTMPIERVDANGEATTQPNGNGTPTVPLGTPVPAAASGLAGAQLVGAPNRTMVAIADTDPAGRPVATAAAVAALTQPVGYGRLVVLSSNFAGKEFELSRPQMIIGRTDENDIVINHRSISRNHAKLVREPETGRYTISDLQSSNGVRVNGQDYSKVELRRGDVVDLGHVRLRFIEPGEDFLFARDAVITDVPESGGGKRGLLVAIVLAVLVLGGVGVFVMTRGGDDGGKKPQGSNDIVTPTGSGTGADNTIADGSDNIVVENNNPTEDSGTGVAPTNPNTNVTVNTEDVALKCAKLKADRKWSELVSCGDELSAADPVKGKEFHDTGIAENKADSAVRNLQDANKNGDYAAAKKFAKMVPESSVYNREAKDFLENTKNDFSEKQHRLAKAAMNNCKDYNQIIRASKNAGLDEEWMRVKCTGDGTVAVKQPNNDGSGSNTKVTPPPKDPPDKPEACDADALKKKGDDYLGNGMDTAALAQFEASLRCKYDSGVVKTAFLAACRSKQAGKAKLYYAKLPPNQTSNYSQICLRFGITVP